MMKKILAVLCFLVLIGLVWQSDPSQLWQYMLQWNRILIACIAVWAIGYLFNAVSFRSVIRSCEPNVRIGWKRVLKLTIGGYALNYITPFGLLGGEPWRIYELRKELTPQGANSAVTYYAMMHVLSHIVFWLIGIAMAILGENRFWFEANLNDIPSVIVMVIVMVSVIVIVMLAYRYAIRRGWIASLSSLMREHPRQFWTALSLELISRMVNVVEYWLLMAVVFPDSPLATYTSAYLVVAFSSLFANLLFFSPMQMGTREGGIFLALEALAPGYPELLPVAVSISFATRIREFFWIAMGLLLLRPKLTNSQIHKLTF